MPRRSLRNATDVILHVMNRAARRLPLFQAADEYAEFLEVIERCRLQAGIDLLAYCVMPNHFHLIVRPNRPRQLSEFMRRLQLTHAKRFHRRHDSTGCGAVYQGRFRAVPIQADGHFVVCARYVERNPLRAGLVGRAEDWPWSSLYQRCKGCNSIGLTEWPIPPSSDWTARVNELDSQAEIAAIRKAVEFGVPFGSAVWSDKLLDRRLRVTRGRPPRDTVGISGA